MRDWIMGRPAHLKETVNSYYLRVPYLAQHFVRMFKFETRLMSSNGVLYPPN